MYFIQANKRGLKLELPFLQYSALCDGSDGHCLYW